MNRSMQEPTVFLVDDDASVRNALKRGLTAAGFSVRASANADAFLAEHDPEGKWRLFAWLGLGLVIYLTYGRRHSLLGQELRRELGTHGVSPAGMPLDGPKL